MINTVSVVVPTSRRIEQVKACLHALRSQTRPPDEVIVVVHASDDESSRLIDGLARDWNALRLVRTPEPGLVAALNRGLAAASGEVVAFIDDDCVPVDDWMARIVEIYRHDGRIAAVGGRDAIFEDGQPFTTPRRRLASRLIPPPPVGRVQWFGRVLGNHHVGTGPARDVDLLKGVNMSYRREAVAEHGFDPRLRGVGAQVHSEPSICLPLRRRGQRVIYDPNIVVRHYPASRSHGDHRHDVTSDTIATITHNETLQVLDYFGPPRRVVFGIWGVAVGTRSSPGLAVFALELLALRPRTWPRFVAAQRGRLAAWRTHRTVPRESFVTAAVTGRAVQRDGLDVSPPPTRFLMRRPSASTKRDSPRSIAEAEK